MITSTWKLTRVFLAHAVPFALLGAACARTSTTAGQSGAVSRAPVPTAVCHESWGDPFDARTSDGRRIHVEAPHPIRVRHGVALLGSPTFVWETAESFVDSLGHNSSAVDPKPFIGILLRSDGTVSPIRRPPNVRGALRDVIATGGQDGIVDVFFATPPAATPEDLRYASQVWHATFDGDVWSTPELVTQAQSIEWYSGPMVGLLKHNGVLHLAASVFDTSHAPAAGVLYARRDRAGWHTRWLDAPGPLVGFLAFAPLGRDSIGLFFTGDMHPADSLAHIGVIWTADNGATWGEPKPIRPITLRSEGHWLQAISVDHTIHLVWANTTYLRARPGEHTTVVHLTTTDGSSWRAQSPLQFVNALSGFAATARPDGHIEALGQGGDTNGGLTLATLNDTTWTTMRLDDEAIGRATIEALTPDSVYVTWSRVVIATFANRPLIVPKMRMRLGALCAS